MARKRIELLAGLDPLGQRGDAALAREADQAAQDGELVRVAMGLVHEAAIDLDELGMQLQDVRHARITGPHVVDGEHGRGGRPHLESAPEFLVVRDRLVLGDLDHPGRKLAQDSVHPRVEERAGREIHEEADIARRCSPLADGLQAGQLEFGTDPEIGGVLEPLVGTAAAGDRCPGQHFEAEDRTVGQAHDRLGRHFDRAGTQELVDQSRERIASDGGGRIRALTGVIPHCVIHL